MKMSMNNKSLTNSKNAPCYVPTVILKFIPKTTSLSNLSVTRASLRGSVTVDALAESGIEPHIASFEANVMSVRSVPWLVPANSKNFLNL